MKFHIRRVTIATLITGVASGAVSFTAAAQPKLEVKSVCTSVACVAPTSQPPVRRGTTETIRIRGPFVDHVNSNGVSVTGLTISNFEKEVCGSEGCMEFKINVPSGRSLGSLITVSLKTLTDAAVFNLKVVRRGEITAMSQVPAEGVWGEEVRVKLTGIDIGNARVAVAGSTVSVLDNASTAYGTDSVRFAVDGTGNPQTSSGMTVGDTNVPGVLGDYRFTTPTRTIKYSASAGQPSCATTPNIGAPSLSSPAGGQIFTFASATSPIQAAIRLAWGASFQGQFKATEKFILQVGPVPVDPRTAAASGGLTVASDPARTSLSSTVTYTTGQGVYARDVLLNRNTAYRWRVKADNCGINGPYSAYSTFRVQ